MNGQILVVDGAATNRITLKVRLAAACYDPLTARTGDEALAALARCQPTLVLIGGEPGDMTAMDLCRRIVAEFPRTPVMMVVAQDARIAALQAGAAAVIEAPIDDMNLFARIRALMRDQNDAAPMLTPGLAEEQASFEFATAAAATRPTMMLVAESTSEAVGWRQALAPRVTAQLRVANAERALSEAAVGLVPDLYLIAGDITQPGDGLRLLSELRARRHSRTAAFAVVLAPERQDMMSVALDLGAGDVLAGALGSPGAAEEAALRLSALIRTKRAADRNRAAVEHERSLALLDPLTGLVNRRFALPRLADLCGRGEACTVLAMDIDCFKRVNDHYGHAAGDTVLNEVAARLDAVCRAPGFVARMGGEEFLVVLPDMTDSESELVARRLRRAVSERPIVLSEHGPSVEITVSAGLARCDILAPGAGTPRAEALLRRADEALLNAKRAGRDRLIVAPLGAAA